MRNPLKPFTRFAVNSTKGVVSVEPSDRTLISSPEMKILEKEIQI